MIFDTIIIGGGISGLYTNLELCNQRDKTLLLEMSPVFGGEEYINMKTTRFLSQREQRDLTKTINV